MQLYIYGLEGDRTALDERLAKVHAQYVLTRIKQLQCPKEQKLALVDAIVKKVSSSSFRGDSAHRARSA